jgi:hypothetical protein
MKIVIIISLSLLAILAAAAAVIITSPTTVQAQAQQQIQLQQPPPTTPATAGSNGNVSILSSSQIRSEFGSTYIVGEVRNDLSDVVQFVQIVGRFYDSNDLLIDTDFTYTNLDLLRPGEKSPFRLIISDESVAQRIDNYTLSVNWDPVFADPSAVAAATVLTIQEGEQRINDLGWYEIVGEVVNGGTDDTEFVKVVATFYDETGRVIDTDFTYTDPTDVPAGQSAPFELTVNDEEPGLFRNRPRVSNNWNTTTSIKNTNNADTIAAITTTTTRTTTTTTTLTTTTDTRASIVVAAIETVTVGAVPKLGPLFMQSLLFKSEF